MASRAVTTRLGSLNSYRYSVDSYDSTKLGLGPLIYQYAGSAESGYAGPAAVTVARPFEQSTAIASAFPWAMQWQNNAAGEIDWVFMIDNSAAGTSPRKLNMYLYNRRTSVWTWQGFITTAFPSATTNYTSRGLRMTYDLEITGTVAVSGTAVTGTSTLFQTNKVCAGNRIGFGSTDPTQITTWYEISSIGSNTSITLVATAGTVTAGTAYVIEDLRAVLLETNNTTTSGGLYVVKGLQIAAFTTGGTAIAAASATDSVRAVYWIADASTITNTVAFGMGIEPKTSVSSQMVYVLDTTTTPTVFKYNIKAALTLTTGKDTTAFQFKTAAAAALSGTPTQLNNGRVATLSHGPHSGVPCLYFTTSTRIYAAPTAGITSGSTTWLANGSMATEQPPGSVNTFAASSLISSIEYASNIDKFVVPVNATTTPFRSYVTQYRTDGGPWDRVFGLDNRQIDQVAVDASTTPVPSMSGASYSAWAEAGLCYIATTGATAILNRVYALPFGADWEYTNLTNSYLVLPAMSTPEASKYTNVFISEDQVLGTGNTGKNLGLSTEPLRVSYRTSGITDDTGAWTLLDSTGVFSQDGATSIQLRVEFRTIGITCLPARVHGATVLYEDLGTDSHYQPSVANSDAAGKHFAWRFSTAFGSTVPALRVRLYDAVTGGLLLDDTTTASAYGLFEKSTNDGSSWGSYNTTDKASETTYIRYTPTSLGSGIKVRALLTQ